VPHDRSEVRPDDNDPMTNAFWRGTIILAIERAIEVELGSMDVEIEKTSMFPYRAFVRLLNVIDQQRISFQNSHNIRVL
jgi:hypothetical protein